MMKRQTRILETLTRDQRADVSALAEMLDVSQVTVRKDLDQLEERGLIRREHGFAVIGSVDDVGRRLAYHYDTKLRIARAAAEEVRDGETVMIESGSCCALLAELLCSLKQDITIITNSAFIAGHVRQAPSGRIVLLGGDYQKESQVMVGPITKKCAEVFFVQKLFIGADGFSEEQGFTGRDHLRAQSVRDMAAQAQELIVLTESEKFNQRGVVSLVKAGEVAALFTDDRIPPPAEAHLLSCGIRVRKVSGNSGNGQGNL